jgi:four helix bundle protein
MAKGSAMEIETQIIIAMKLHYLNEELGNKLLSNIEVILKMLTKFIQYKKFNGSS